MMQRIISLIFILSYAILQAMGDTVTKNDTIKIAPSGYASEILTVTGSLNTNRPTVGIGKQSWGIGWNSDDGKATRLTLSWGNSEFGDITDQRYMLIRITREDSLFYENKITKGVNLYTGPNTLRIHVDREGSMSWSIVENSLAANGELAMPSPKQKDSPFFIFANGSDLKLLRANVTEGPISPVTLQTPFIDSSDFPVSTQINNDPSGIWYYLDRNTDPKWARLGGRYTLGIKKDTDDRWSIIYLSGAQTNAPRWKPGMLKGALYSMPFQSHYNLEWYDASFEFMDEEQECSATMNEDGSILTLNFPLDHSSIRFYRKLPTSQPSL